MKMLLIAIAATTASFVTFGFADAADLPMDPVYKTPMVAAV